jgi:hypothetical protein
LNAEQRSTLYCGFTGNLSKGDRGTMSYSEDLRERSKLISTDLPMLLSSPIMELSVERKIYSLLRGNGFSWITVFP